MSDRKLDGIMFENEHVIFDPHEYIFNVNSKEQMDDEEVSRAFWRGVETMCEKGDASIVCLLAKEGDADDGTVPIGDIFNIFDGSMDDVMERALKTAGVFHELSYRQALNLWTVCTGSMGWKRVIKKIGDISKGVQDSSPF